MTYMLQHLFLLYESIPPYPQEKRDISELSKSLVSHWVFGYLKQGSMSLATIF